MGLLWGVIVIVAYFAAMTALGQSPPTVRMSLTMSPKPSPYISDWSSKKETVIITITNSTNETLSGKFDAQVTRDGSLAAKTKLGSMPAVSVPPGVSTFFADQVLPFNAVTIYGNAQETAIRTGMLPAGSYQLCVSLLDANNPSATLTASPSCRSFSLTSYQPPQLTLPVDKAQVATITPVTFKWIGVTPTPGEKTVYRVMVFEVLKGQTPIQAFKSNTPIIDREAMVKGQMLWPGDVPGPVAGKTYVWSVRALNDKGAPVGDPDGFAQPFSFTAAAPGGSTHDSTIANDRSDTGKGDGRDPIGGGTGRDPIGGSGGGVIIYPGFTDPYTNVPKKAVSFSGVIRDAHTNAPLANATVELVPTEQKLFGFTVKLPAQTVTTGANGTFTFASVMAPTFYRLKVKRQGYHDVLQIGASYKIEAPIANYVVPMKPRRLALIGQVRDKDDGTAVTNAVVELWKRPTAWCDACPANQNLGLEGGGGGMISMGGGNGRGSGGVVAPNGDKLIASTKTLDFEDPPANEGGGMSAVMPHFWGSSLYMLNDGSFTFSDVEPWSNYYLKITHPHFQNDEVVHIPVGSSDTINLGQITIKAKHGKIIVTVKDKKTGKPIANADVFVYPDVGAPPVTGIGGTIGTPMTAEYNPAIGNTGMIADYRGIVKGTKDNRPYVPGGGGVRTSSESDGATMIGGVIKWTDASSGWTQPSGTSSAPEKMPAIPALYKAVTDANGKATLPKVVINDPDQTTDRYAVWARATFMGDAWKPVRITKNGQVVEITISMDSAKGFIEGRVRRSGETTPIASAKVQLYHKVMGTEKVYKEVLTNPDGTYTIYPIAPGSYTKLSFSAAGYAGTEVAGPIAVVQGAAMTFNADLIGDVGAIKVKAVVGVGAGAQPLANVFVHSPTTANITGVTALDGTVLLSGVPVGDVTLNCSLPGYADKTVTVKVTKGATAAATASMTKSVGSINVLVVNKTTNQPVANAAVSVAGAKATTDMSGLAVFPTVNPGATNVTALADTTGSADYEPYKAAVAIKEGVNAPITVKLTPGTRISGTVVEAVGGLPVDSVMVSLKGVSIQAAMTGADGSYVLRNVPTGVALEVLGKKAKYMLGKASAPAVAAGQQKTGVDMALEASYIDSVYGFAVTIDTITDGPGGNKYLKGSFTVPDNMLFAKNTEAKFDFVFENLEVDPVDFKPVAGSYSFGFDKAPIKLFGALAASLSGGDDFLKATYDTANATGAIRGKTLELPDLLSKIPGASFASQKLTALGGNTNSLGFWADGAFHGSDVLKLDASAVELNLWGFKMKVDYSKTTMKADGFHFAGSLTIPKINKTVVVDDLFFKKTGEGEAASLEFESVKLINQPPLEINLFAFKFVDSTLSWSKQGLAASGKVVLTKLGNRTFRFQDLFISSEGKFMGVKVIADNMNTPLEVLGSKFYLTALGFKVTPEVVENGAVTTPEMMAFSFSGKLELPKLSKPVEFQNLTFTDQGDFSGSILFNQKVDFAGVVSLELQALEFGKQKVGAVEKKFIFVKGGVAFSIPLLSVQVGNFRFFEDKTFAVEKIGFAFKAGPVNASLSAMWTDTSFSGAGVLAVQPILSIGGSFYYANGSNWKIEIAANIPPIPIGPVAITGVSGMLAQKNGWWAFGFGGSVATAGAKDALEMTLKVAVETTAQGPIIQGDAWLKSMGVQIGEAHLTINIPQQLFSGSILFGFDKKAVKIAGFINFEVKSGVYWFVGGGATFDFINVMKVQTQIMVGKNYPGYAHSFPVLYHPDNEVLNGLHFDAQTTWPKIGKSGETFQLEFSYYLFGAFNWNGDLAGGMKVKGAAALDVWVVGFSVDLEAQAAIQYKNGGLAFSASVDLEGKAWFWPCEKASACDEWCKFCPCVHAYVTYASAKGWDASFSIACDE